MATLHIDDKPYTVKPGKNLLETCLSLGFDLPYFCWHPALGSVGACRQCAIKVYKDGDDRKGRLMMSCMEPVTDNQWISISDPEAAEFRASVIEWLMTNHPHDCAVCDEGGSCHLQDMTVMTGHAYRRFRYKKRTYKNQYLGPFINHEMNRCIQCYRCVRFYKDYAGGSDLDVFASKNNVYFGRHQPGVLESEFSGNLTEVCPTGVFTDKTLKEHYTRKWDLTSAPSVCHHCSLGCNTSAGERYGSLRLIANRYNGQVNGYFLCDRGRFGYEFVNAPDRIREAYVHGVRVDEHKVLRELEGLSHGAIIGIGSPRASLETNFVLKTLVGEDNFYLGVADVSYHLTALAAGILADGHAQVLSMKDVEKADAVLILGEDLTNTAPMMALAVRQSVRQKPMERIAEAKIPSWNDAAARELIQDEKGPLFMATVGTTKLDEIAAGIYRGAPEDIARLGFAIAQALDSGAPPVEDLSVGEEMLAQHIAKQLASSRRPVVISGTSLGSEAVLKAAANVATALHQRNREAGIVLTFPECNSLGLTMIGGQPLSRAFDVMKKNSHVHTVIIAENDLFRHGDKDLVRVFLEKCNRVVVLDHTTHETVRHGHVVIPAGTFAEADGTLVNNEGRAQRFFQVYVPGNGVQESWRWLLKIGTAMGNNAISSWRNLDDIARAISEGITSLKGVENIAPAADYRIHGQKIPRESHRFSGRTAMNAHIHVSEQKPPTDPDSALSYTMEGFRGLPPSPMIPYFWSPGWNSMQSVNKYQEEVGGALRGGDPGIRLLGHSTQDNPDYYTDVPVKFKPPRGRLWIVPQYHIYGSEELSANSPAVALRIPSPVLLISAEDASELHLSDHQVLSLGMREGIYLMPVKITTALPRGVALLPHGFPGQPYHELPAWGTPQVSENKMITVIKEKQYD